MACFAVVMLHTTALNTYNVEFHSHSWNVIMFYESIVNWAVPVFVMMSGSLMLSKDYSFQEIVSKLINIILLFLPWSFLYLVLDVYHYGTDTYLDSFVWLQVLIQGHYHMWYLFMLFGLYLITLFIRKICVDKVLCRAFIIISLVATFGTHSISDAVANIGSGGYYNSRLLPQSIPDLEMH